MTSLETTTSFLAIFSRESGQALTRTIYARRSVLTPSESARFLGTIRLSTVTLVTHASRIRSLLVHRFTVVAIDLFELATRSCIFVRTFAGVVILGITQTDSGALVGTLLNTTRWTSPLWVADTLWSFTRSMTTTSSRTSLDLALRTGE